MKIIVESIEDAIVKLEITEDSGEFHYETKLASVLDIDVKEGDVVYSANGKYHTDEEATQLVKENAQSKLDMIFNKK